MKEQTWDLLDKSAWPPGPWRREPDKAQWNDPITGLACMARRNPRYGHWCGYVGLPPDHPLHGVGYGDIPFGLPGTEINYSELCEGDHVRGICHVPEPGDPDPLWWVGFDFGHFGDLSPAMADPDIQLRPLDWMGTYKPLDDVRASCSVLAVLLEALAEPKRRAAAGEGE